MLIAFFIFWGFIVWAVAKQERESLAIVSSSNKENLSPQLFPMQRITVPASFC